MCVWTGRKTTLPNLIPKKAKASDVTFHLSDRWAFRGCGARWNQWLANNNRTSKFYGATHTRKSKILGIMFIISRSICWSFYLIIFNKKKNDGTCTFFMCDRCAGCVHMLSDQENGAFLSNCLIMSRIDSATFACHLHFRVPTCRQNFSQSNCQVVGRQKKIYIYRRVFDNYLVAWARFNELFVLLQRQAHPWRPGDVCNNEPKLISMHEPNWK